MKAREKLWRRGTHPHGEPAFESSNLDNPEIARRLFIKKTRKIKTVNSCDASLTVLPIFSSGKRHKICMQAKKNSICAFPLIAARVVIHSFRHSESPKRVGSWAGQESGREKSKCESVSLHLPHNQKYLRVKCLSIKCYTLLHKMPENMANNNLNIVHS